MSEITEIDAMKAIDDALSKINDIEVKDRILNWAWDKFSSKPTLESEAGEEGFQGGKVSKKKSNKKKGTKKKSKPSKKAKTSLSIIKDLNLKPKSKKALDVFVNEKWPISNFDKVTVSVFYLKHTLSVPKVTLNHIYTCFKNIKWRVPADLANTLAQAGTRGLIDCSDSENIKLATHGENLVEHDLPKKKGKK